MPHVRVPDGPQDNGPSYAASRAVGTIKSRVNRARHRLALLLEMEPPVEAD